jgi:hypothetical protein
MIGRVYLEHGQPVTVMAPAPFTRWHVAEGLMVVIWGPPRGHPIKGCPFAGLAKYKGAPRNVLIRRSDGSQTVRPFRGLRRVNEVNQDRSNEGCAHA